MNTAIRPKLSPTPAVTVNRLQDFLSKALAGFPWLLNVVEPDGKEYSFGGDKVHWCGQPLTVKLHTDAVVRDLMSLNGFTFLERFLVGEVDLTGNLFILTDLGAHLRLALSRRQLLAAFVRNNLFQTSQRTRANVTSHYDIPQEFIAQYLDKRYISYSCAMFEKPCNVDPAELVAVGAGEADSFDSLEKAQWRKYRDAIDFIDPSRGETLLDIGCGYGGQLDVAMESHPFGKVVGWTHSRNQVTKGRENLSRFDPAYWEIHEGDYREESRVFDHLTSMGMISHVGPRGLVPYVRNVRRLIKQRGRYVHHALMTPTPMKPFTADVVGAAFNKKYVWPGFHWFTLAEHVEALQRNGFEIVKVVNLSEHYAKTTAAWYQRMIAGGQSMVDKVTYRAWQIYSGPTHTIARESLVLLQDSRGSIQQLDVA